MRILKHIRDYFYFNELIRNKNEEKIIYLLSPRHGNLGDQMISIATRKILDDFYPEKIIIEIEDKLYRKNKEKIKKYINKNDIIVLQGGGNLGDIWLNEEILRREILEEYSDNKIIIMPQTITFNTAEETKESQRIYSKVRDLTIITREEYSYESGKEIFSKNKVLLIPDSVFYLEDYYQCRLNKNRKGALFLLRKDIEKTISNEVSDSIAEILKKINLDYTFGDTVIEEKGKMSKYTREKFCNNLLEEISTKKLIITDRLHGMIFSIITNTPAVVFGSGTKKTVGSLKWAKHLEYISFIEDGNDLEKMEKEIKRLLSLKVEKEKYQIKEIMKKKFKDVL